MNGLWKFFTSLKLTIWLLAVSVVLVLLGSFAQVHEGLWNAQERWFKEWLVIRHAGDPWWVPPVFPGGHLLGTLLLLNLLAAHAKRFSWSFQKVGIQLTHLGIIMLLVGQFMTDEMAVESHMSFREGETKQYTEHHRDSELFFVQDREDGDQRVISVPEGKVERRATITHPELPFIARVQMYSVNGDVLEKKEVLEKANQLNGALGMVEGKYTGGDLVELAKEAAISEGRAAVWRDALRTVGEKDVTDLAAATQRVAADATRAGKFRDEVKQRFKNQMLDANKRQGGEAAYVADLLAHGKTIEEASLPKLATNAAGERFFAIPRPEQKANDTRNLPFSVVEIEQGGKSLGTWLLSPTLREQAIPGTPWKIGMRFERFYVPFKMTLLSTKHDVYQGTEIAKDYRSRVRIENPQTGESRETEIYMNQPLRYAGLTFYQYQMGTDQRGTPVKTSTLQVVENPSWLTPYAGCLVVGLGMLWQFLWHLGKFFSKRMGIISPELSQAHTMLPAAAIIFVLPDLWLLHRGYIEGSAMAVVAAACTLILRVLMAWQIWQGRFLGFALVFVATATILMVPFAIKYHGAVGDMLWPLVGAQTLVIAALVTAIRARNTAPATTPA